MPSGTSKTKTFLFTDVVRSTNQMERDERSTLMLLERHDQIIRGLVEEHRGHVFKQLGDGCCTAFDTATDALKAALTVQRAMLREPWQRLDPASDGLRVRIAIHAGEAVWRDDDYHGLELALTARLLSHVEGGQILLTQPAEQLIRGRTPPEVNLVDRGERRFKGLERVVRVYEVRSPELPEVPTPPAPPAPEPIFPTEDAERHRTFEETMRAVLEAVREGVHVPLTREQIRRIVAHRARDLAEYRVGRLAEWSQGRYQIDRRFVRMTLRIGRTATSSVTEEPKIFHDLRDVLEDVEAPAVVAVGPPGCGKSTLLRRLELDLAMDALRGGSDRVTFFLPLNSFDVGAEGESADPWMWLRARWRHRFGRLVPLESLVARGQVVFLLDALNEMPHSTDAEYRERVGQWRRFLDRIIADFPGNRAVFSCRTLDYSAPLATDEVPVPRLVVEPLDDAQVHAFLHAYCPYAAEDVWKTLEGRPELELLRLPYFLELLAGQVELDGRMPGGQVALFTSFVRRALQREIERDEPLFAPGGVLSPKDHARAALNASWRTPHTLPTEGPLEPGLRKLAYGMQRARPSVEAAQVRVDHEGALEFIEDERAPQVLEAGLALGVLDEDQATDEVLFRHQLLQEYFAAREVARKPKASLARSAWKADEIRPSLEDTIAALAPPDPLPPPPATGWEESMVMAAAMVPDPATFVERLAEENLPLAGRCAAQSDVKLPEELVEKLRWRLVERSRDPAADLRARIAAGLALGPLGDPRFERRMGPYGPYLLPPMVEIPGGTYIIGSDEGIYEEEAPQHTVELAPFRIGKFPVTNAEWKCFMDAGGYEDERWWETPDAQAWRHGIGTSEGHRFNLRLVYQQFRADPTALDRAYADGGLSPEWTQAWRNRLRMTPSEFESYVADLYPDRILRQPAYWTNLDFCQPSLPVTGVSWYEARAYCSWLSAEAGMIVRLPTEVEREGATRGSQGRRFAYGDRFDSLAANTLEAHVRRPTPVGVFPLGDSPECMADANGNAYDWTISLIDDEEPSRFSYPYDRRDGRENVLASREVLRVARGGAWGFDWSLARATCRYWARPSVQLDVVGLRLVSGATDAELSYDGQTSSS